MKSSAANMAARADTMRNPRNSGVIGRGKLVIAIGIAPTLGKNGSKTNNSKAIKVKK